MREIKFRGKRVDDGEWFYGCLSYVDSRSQKIGSDFGSSFICQVQHSWQKTDSGYNIGWWIQVETKTVGQFTGLHDKNGVEIYEGDILHLYGEDTINKYDWKAVVEFGNPNGLYSWGYQLDPITEFGFNTDILAWINMDECGIYAEVIGNIHEVHRYEN